MVWIERSLDPRGSSAIPQARVRGEGPHPKASLVRAEWSKATSLGWLGGQRQVGLMEIMSGRDEGKK